VICLSDVAWLDGQRRWSPPRGRSCAGASSGRGPGAERGLEAHGEARKGLGVPWCSSTHTRRLGHQRAYREAAAGADLLPTSNTSLLGRAPRGR